MGTQPSAFLSHSSEDHEFVRRLAADLRRDGVRVWVDEAEIKVGDSILDKISQGIAEADFLVVMLSEASAGSRWVQAELKPFLWDQIDDDRTRVLVCKIGDCDVPVLLKDRRYASFVSMPYDQAYDELLAALLPSGMPSTDARAVLRLLASPEEAKRSQAIDALPDIHRLVIEKALAMSAGAGGPSVRTAMEGTLGEGVTHSAARARGAARGSDVWEDVFGSIFGAASAGSRVRYTEQGASPADGTGPVALLHLALKAVGDDTARRDLDWFVYQQVTFWVGCLEKTVTTRGLALAYARFGLGEVTDICHAITAAAMVYVGILRQAAGHEGVLLPGQSACYDFDRYMMDVAALACEQVYRDLCQRAEARGFPGFQSRVDDRE